jgi:hypothetical protein
MAETFELREYTEAGRSPFAQWFDALETIQTDEGKRWH